jgi:hypothetical protein
MNLLYRIDGFSEGSRFDWLHPQAGLFPDYAGQYEDNGHQFTSVVWVTNDSWVSAVEGPELVGPPVWTGGFLMTYRWWPRDRKCSKVFCRPNEASVFDLDIEKEDQDAERILEVLAVGSIYLYCNVTR